MDKLDNLAKVLTALGVAVLVAGCSSTGGDGPPLGENQGGGTNSEVVAGSDDGFTRGIGDGDGISGGAVDGGGSDAGSLAPPPADAVFYFDFDSSSVRGEYADLLAAHARYIQNNGVLSVRLEGHADERGSREYNIGLGERRAQAVRQALLTLRVPAARMQTVSYGEERPASFGHDDRSWAANRRVEIVYGSR